MRNPLRSHREPVLSLTADYALCAILALASAGGRALKAPQIAERTGAPANYMSKTLNVLAKAGLLRSRRGATGGFTLAVPPERLTVARIADVFTEPRPRARCLLGNGPCNPRSPCAVHHHWTAVVEATRAPLQTTIAQLLGEAATADE
jgi:Rrf2 family protein